MDVHIELEKIDLSNHVLGDLGFPSLEAEIRRLAAEYIKGVLENNLRLDVQQAEFDADGEQTGPMYVVLWANLSDGWESAIAEVKVDDLFKEFMQKKELTK
jgi:hypothetical protein